LHPGCSTALHPLLHASQPPTYTEIIKGQAICLYRSSNSYVHSSEREHALQHSCFCHNIYCNTTPVCRTWVNHPVKCPAPPTSCPRETSSPTGPTPPMKIGLTTPSSLRPLRRAATEAESNMRLPYSPSQERHTSSREAPTSSTLLPYRIDQHGHLYMHDPSPRPSLASSALPSPTSAIRSTKGWLMTLQNLLTNVKKKIANGSPSKTAGIEGLQNHIHELYATSKDSKCTLQDVSAHFNKHGLTIPEPSTTPRPIIKPLAFTRPQQLPLRLLFLKDPLPPSHHPSRRVPVPSGCGRPL